MNHFNEFEETVGKIDAANQELFLLGDINVDLTPGTTSANATKLKTIFDIFGLGQLIEEPTGITLNSRTLIDLCVTNAPSKILNSGFVHIAVSDHSLVYDT